MSPVVEEDSAGRDGRANLSWNWISTISVVEVLVMFAPCMSLLKCCLGKKIWFSIKVESSFNHSSSLVAGKLLIS